MKPPYVIEVEVECEDCGGSRYDCGSLGPIEPEECPLCLGNGKQMTVHNYLAEALRMAGNSAVLARRKHLGHTALPQPRRRANGYIGDRMIGTELDSRVPFAIFGKATASRS
jgi:hypothetical protein